MEAISDLHSIQKLKIKKIINDIFFTIISYIGPIVSMHAKIKLYKVIFPFFCYLYTYVPHNCNTSSQIT